MSFDRIAEEISEIQFEIWRTHDQKKYDELERYAEMLLQKTGIPTRSVEETARRIRQVFAEYDAVDNQANREDLSQSDLLKKLGNVHILLTSVLRSCGDKNSSEIGWYHTLLWREYVNKSKSSFSLAVNLRIGVLLLFLECRRLGLKKAIGVFPFLLIGGWMGHYGRSRRATVLFLTPYYKNTRQKDGARLFPDIFH